MACWQCSHEMSGATRVVDSMVCLFLFFLLHAVHSTITCNRIKLDQLLDNFLLAISFDALGNTGLQVPLQDDRLQFLKRLAHGVRLAQDVDAILILFHHLAYACNVSLDVRETLQHICLSIPCSLLALSSKPPQAQRIAYHSYRRDCHSSRRKDRGTLTQERNQGRENGGRYQDHVVGKSPEEILLDGAHRRP